MQTNEFLSLLKEHSAKSLLFKYGQDKTVGGNYHITEVKNITVDSVDCGAGTDFWKETVIQLWESPTERATKKYMTSMKALGILQKVAGIKPMSPEAEIKFEYGNANFHTAQLFVSHFEILPDQLILSLSVEKTACKALDICGVVAEPASVAEPCCTPNSGCC